MSLRPQSEQILSSLSSGFVWQAQYEALLDADAANFILDFQKETETKVCRKDLVTSRNYYKTLIQWTGLCVFFNNINI